MSADRQPHDFGRSLREARERRGLSLRQIAQTTKISIGTLEALERNDLSRLPGGIFSRAFVRAYAIEVGLSPDETIQEFIARFPHASVTAGHPISRHVEDNGAVWSNRRTASKVLRLFAISLPVAALVAFLATAGWRGRPAFRAAPSTDTQTRDRPARGVITAPVISGRQAANAARAIDRLTVTVSVTRPCRVVATIDGRKTIDRLFQTGEMETLAVPTELVLTAEDAGAVVLTLNGTAARPLGKAGEAVTARVTPTNFRDYLSSP